jgi:ApbE superfamily uncharacterized protein (UPF0280 family)
VAPAAGEKAFQVVVGQTDLHVVARTDLASAVGSFLHGLRAPLQTYIAAHPEFLASLVPLEAPAEAPALVRDMAEAARACGVGPMAAVAGAIAQAVADRFAAESPDILVENGGDCYLHSTRPRTVALLADPAGGPALGLRLDVPDFPCSLCSSSASIGHSLSLGAGELVAVRAGSGALADAAATALCNLLRTRRDLDRVTAAAQALHPAGVDGVFAQLGGAIAVWGEMELVALG